MEEEQRKMFHVKHRNKDKTDKNKSVLLILGDK